MKRIILLCLFALSSCNYAYQFTHELNGVLGLSFEQSTSNEVMLELEERDALLLSSDYNQMECMNLEAFGIMIETARFHFDFDRLVAVDFWPESTEENFAKIFEALKEEYMAPTKTEKLPDGGVVYQWIFKKGNNIAVYHSPMLFFFSYQTGRYSLEHQRDNEKEGDF